MQLVIILVIAFLLLLVVGLLLRGSLGGGSERLNFAEPALQPEIPSRALMERIFAEEDLTFVAGEHSRMLRRLFLYERRRLALSWLSQARHEATRILSLHLRVVRTDHSLQPLVELRLFFRTLLFFAIYGLLWSLVRCYGPFWARSFMRNLVSLAGKLNGLGSDLLTDAGTPLSAAGIHGHA
jgi:hypothetical protein